MSTVLAAADFVYGNTRLRSRRSALFSPADYDVLAGHDLGGLIAALAEGAYRQEIEDALVTAGGARAVREALRRHLARALTEMRSFYDGAARSLVDLLLSRYDLHNLLVLLRGRARGHPPADVIANLVPLGRLGTAAGVEIARQHELEAGVGLLIAWRLPSPPVARALARAWPEYERTEDLAELERALLAAHADVVERELGDVGAAADPARELVARERDATNLMTVLRLRAEAERDEQASAPGHPGEPRLLAGGSIRRDLLEAALRQPTRAEAAADLAAAVRRADWRRPLERFAARGDLTALERELERSRVRWAVGLFLRGDPLGIDLPIAYTVAIENENRNLRLLAEGAAGGLPPADLRARLLLPGTADR